MDAFLAGMEQARPTGTTCPRSGSVASFFVSPVDTEIDKRLDKLGTEEAKALRGKAAIANARLAYAARTRSVLRRPVDGSGDAGARRSGRCGPPPGSRTRTTPTRSTSTSWSRPAPSTRCRSRRCRRSPTTARSAATRSAMVRRGATGDGRPRGARHRLRRRGRGARGRGCAEVHRLLAGAAADGAVRDRAPRRQG